jgi:hypothetical protein
MRENGTSGLPIQFGYIDRATQSLISWTKEQSIPLLRVEYSVPFVPTDKHLDVFLFFDAAGQTTEYEDNKTAASVEEKYLDILAEFGYPEEYLQEVFFDVNYVTESASL